MDQVSVYKGRVHYTAIPLLLLMDSYRRAKKNAPSRGLSFSLTVDDVRSLVVRSNGFCEVSGIPFLYRTTGGSNPWAASIDRIDSSKGYSFDNCRLVCVAVNFAMNQWGERVLREIARAMYDPKYRKALQTGKKFLNCF